MPVALTNKALFVLLRRPRPHEVVYKSDACPWTVPEARRPVRRRCLKAGRRGHSATTEFPHTPALWLRRGELGCLDQLSRPSSVADRYMGNRSRHPKHMLPCQPWCQSPAKEQKRGTDLSPTIVCVLLGLFIRDNAALTPGGRQSPAGMRWRTFPPCWRRRRGSRRRFPRRAGGGRRVRSGWHRGR